jgi:hypothetical protein
MTNIEKRADAVCEAEHDWAVVVCVEPGCEELGVFHYADLLGRCLFETQWCFEHDPVEEVFSSFMLG